MKEITEISPGAAHRAHLGRTATFKGPTRSFPSPLPSIAIELVDAALKGLLSPALSSKGGEGDRTADSFDKSPNSMAMGCALRVAGFEVPISSPFRHLKAPKGS